MNIQHQDNGEQGEFFILNAQNQKIAELTYFYETPNKINANHTFVSDELRGQGVADKLYLALVALVNEKQFTLHPTCSYIARKWERDTQK